ncbi:hypothetical protein B9Q04_04635 [Candidatus Marsarchaeota G2 archaeon BE_D]|uniref:AB hydrolase-1 domain-containing protein n=1 Tax=Candidatus Marsarchaeota G2 archaeon BE_D TaxID=1978158 RepID=A0A2R6CCN9_9ARCH|nr:MAG: hypothetical protein B9Q04_04635 [Candidatus Marsarchaeota G2 archaeon BE_D]
MTSMVDFSYIQKNAKYLDVKGVRTRYYESGQGPPVVFLHGKTGSMESFVYNLEPLSKSFKVYAFDMIGHGFTDKPEMDYSPKTLMDHAVDFADALGLGSFSLVGHAWGGWISTLISYYHPERVNKVVSICGLNPSSLSSLIHSTDKKMMDSLTLNAAFDPSLDNIRARMKVMFKSYDESVESLALLRSKYYASPGFSKAMSSLIESSKKAEYTLDDKLANLTRPMIFVWGRDCYFGYRQAYNALDVNPRLSLFMVANAGEWVQWEKPEIVNAVIEAYLRDG